MIDTDLDIVRYIFLLLFKSQFFVTKEVSKILCEV